MYIFWVSSLLYFPTNLALWLKDVGDIFSSLSMYFAEGTFLFTCFLHIISYAKFPETVSEHLPPNHWNIYILHKLPFFLFLSIIFFLFTYLSIMYLSSRVFQRSSILGILHSIHSVLRKIWNPCHCTLWKWSMGFSHYGPLFTGCHHRALLNSLQNSGMRPQTTGILVHAEVFRKISSPVLTVIRRGSEVEVERKSIFCLSSTFLGSVYRKHPSRCPEQPLILQRNLLWCINF